MWCRASLGRQTEQIRRATRTIRRARVGEEFAPCGLFAGCFSRRAHDDDADDHSRVQVAIRAGPASDRGHRRGHDRPPLHHATAAALLHAHAVSKTRPMWPAVAAQPADWPRVAGAWGSLGRSSYTRACGKQPPSGFGHFALQRTSRQRYPGGLQPRPALASLGQLAGMFELAGHADFALLLGTGARAIPSARSRSSSCSSCPSRTSASACRGYSWPAQAWGARCFWTGSWPPPLRRPPSNA